jgi:hypothetical protein
MSRVLLFGAAFVVVLYAFIDVLMTQSPRVRTLPKWLWLVVVLVVPVLGAVGWFLLGRPRRDDAAGGLPGLGRRGPVAPDDDPSFLRELDDQAFREQMRRRHEQQRGTGQQPPPERPSSGSSDPAADGPAVDSGSPGPSD